MPLVIAWVQPVIKAAFEQIVLTLRRCGVHLHSQIVACGTVGLPHPLDDIGIAAPHVSVAAIALENVHARSGHNGFSLARQPGFVAEVPSRMCPRS